MIALSNIVSHIGKKECFTELNLSINSKYTKEFDFQKVNNDYIEPYLVEISDGISISLQDCPNVILISAAGATGKTEMCKYLSSVLHIPVYNLSDSLPVASNSLTGLLTKALTPVGLGQYYNAVRDGRQGLIIDAIDEGMMKSGMTSFSAFLTDFKDYVTDRKTTIVMFGRTQSLETVALELNSAGILTCFLRISSFSQEQAREYIDKQVKPKKEHESTYQELRDYILNKVGSYFKNHADVSKSFLGYAPVLSAISADLKGTDNYMSTLSKMRKNDSKGIKVVVDIIQSIIKREKCEKIDTQLLPQFKNEITDSEYRLAEKKIYNEIEQCRAVLHYIMEDKYDIKICDQGSVNQKFCEKINTFTSDHPFLEGRRFQNSVFECYVIAKLISVGEDDDLVEYYLSEYYKDAYFLFYLFCYLYNNREISSKFLPYIYRSLISFDSVGDYGITDILQTSSFGSHSVILERLRDQTKGNWTVNFRDNEEFSIGPIISNISIESERIHFFIDQKSNDVIPPVRILCPYIDFEGEIRIAGNRSEECNEDSSVIINVETCTTRYKYDRPQISISQEKHSSSTSLLIFSDSALQPPFDSYSSGEQDHSDSLTEEMHKVYIKLRKILISFRSHSKGTMARYKSKLLSSRISGDIGKELLDMLCEKKIVVEEGVKYFLDREVTAKMLGLTFDMIKNPTPTSKIKEFINEFLEKYGDK